MDFRILGPLEVLNHGCVVPLGGSKQRALLALLVLHANETLSAERLIDELWGERPPATAAKTLQAHVSRLRKALGASDGAVVTRAHGYELELEPGCLDAHRFERLVGEGGAALGAGRPERALALLEDALALWRGPPLADLAYEPFAQREIARLDELRVAALEELIEAKLALGRHSELVGQLEALVGEHPYRERLRAQLMLALYRSDRQADALQAYQDARRTLVDQLGIEPGERLRRLERRSSPRTRPPPAGGRATGDARACDETPSSAFVGRERELAELIGGLDDAVAGRGSPDPARRRAGDRQKPARRGTDRTGAGAWGAGAGWPLLGGRRCPGVLAMGPIAAARMCANPAPKSYDPTFARARLKWLSCCPIYETCSPICRRHLPL